MNLYIQYDKSNTSGKGKFLSRLVPELERLGVSCSFDDEKGSDIALVITRFRNHVHRPKMPCVLRIDGVHMSNDKGAKYRNGKIAYAIKHADAVIFQSKYCKKMCRIWTGKKGKREHVIFNGDNPEFYKGAHTVFAPDGYSKKVIASAKWCNRNGERKHKGIDKVFAIAKLLPEVYFWVAGQTTKKDPQLPNVELCGHLAEDALAARLRSANLMLYLPEYDFCPNSVVEGICAGLPVVTSDCHGATELVKACDAGVFMNTFTEAYVETIKRLLAHPITPNTEPVDIRNIAKKYKEVFEQCLQ